MAPQPIEVGSIVGIWTYLASLDWEEKWLWVLVGAHLACLTITILTTAIKAHTFQMFIFFALLLLIYCSEYINEWAADNYRLFSVQQYFDSQGMFISLMFSFPLLVNCFIIVMGWMWSTMSLMIHVKRAKVRHDAAAKENKDK